MIALVMSLPAMVVMNALVREKEYSTLESIYATPLKRSEFLVGKLLPYVVTGLISVSEPKETNSTSCGSNSRRTRSPTAA